MEKRNTAGLGRILFLISILLGYLLNLSRANIVDLSGFRLSPLVLVKKSDFTYSSGSQDEDYAAVRFDLAM